MLGVKILTTEKKYLNRGKIKKVGARFLSNKVKRFIFQRPRCLYIYTLQKSIECKKKKLAGALILSTTKEISFI